MPSIIESARKMMQPIQYEDFAKIDLRIGRIVRAEEFPKARKAAYKLWVDFGELGIKRSSAQITVLYKAEELVGRYVVAVVNFPPKQVADFLSEVLVLGAVLENDEDIILLEPERPVPPGTKIA
jgi:tRNA-binding protein